MALRTPPHAPEKTAEPGELRWQKLPGSPALIEDAVEDDFLGLPEQCHGQGEWQ